MLLVSMKHLRIVSRQQRWTRIGVSEMVVLLENAKNVRELQVSKGSVAVFDQRLWIGLKSGALTEGQGTRFAEMRDRQPQLPAIFIDLESLMRHAVMCYVTQADVLRSSIVSAILDAPRKQKSKRRSEASLKPRST